MENPADRLPVGRRGPLLEIWREARQRLCDPVEAWAEITADPERTARYKDARGRGGFVRSTWPEVTELIAAAHVHTGAAWVIWGVWPFSRLVHAWSYPLWYLWRPYIVYRSRRAANPRRARHERPEVAADWHAVLRACRARVVTVISTYFSRPVDHEKWVLIVVGTGAPTCIPSFRCTTQHGARVFARSAADG